MRYIEIEIDNRGIAKVEAFGFNGVGCREATAEIEKALGGGVRSTQDKNDWEPELEHQRGAQH